MENFNQLFTESDLVGKTIKEAVCADEKCIIHFRNNEFAAFKCGGYEIRYIELMGDPINLSIHPYNIADLKNYGFIDNSEYLEYKAVFDKEEKEKKERDERRMYEQLKTKYS